MRVIAGAYRRRKLHMVAGDQTRSTKDSVKESLFNSLQTHLPGQTALDLFAGSGALGIEGVSRGLRFCEFVEKDRRAYHVLLDNITDLAIQQSTNTHQMDALKFLNAKAGRYDLILLDPPYDSDLLKRCLALIEENTILNPHGVIAILTGKTTTVDIPSTLTIKKERTMGITKILLLERRPSL